MACCMYQTNKTTTGYPLLNAEEPYISVRYAKLRQFVHIIMASQVFVIRNQGCACMQAIMHIYA